VPTKPDYPCKRIEKNVEQWLKKIQERNEDSARLNQEAVVIFHPFYSQMEPNDLIISIEHCHSCEHHNVSLRHDPAEYLDKAGKFIKVLANLIFDHGFRIRLGVSIIPADIKIKHDHNEIGSRVGAFEIQIAYKRATRNGGSGENEIELLYSKLNTRRWPSKSVLEKRLASFMSKIDDKSVRKKVDFFKSSTEFTNITDGNHSYPKGHCSWTDVPISDSYWSFQYSRRQSHQWVYDFRLDPEDLPLSEPPTATARFHSGEDIFINSVAFTPDCIEPFPLQGKVKSYTGNSKSSAKRLTVNLKYQLNEVEVNESDCISLGSWNREINLTLDGFPFELEALYLLDKKHDLHLWNFQQMKPDFVNTATGENELSRKSVFHFLRQIAWEIIEIVQKKEKKDIVRHPSSNQPVILNSAYTEITLDWLFNHPSNFSHGKGDWVTVSFLENLFGNLNTVETNEAAKDEASQVLNRSGDIPTSNPFNAPDLSSQSTSMNAQSKSNPNRSMTDSQRKSVNLRIWHGMRPLKISESL
jgi:hypothetical protein